MIWRSANHSLSNSKPRPWRRPRRVIGRKEKAIMMRNQIIVSTFAAVLSGCCTHQQPRAAAVKGKTCVAVRRTVHWVNYQPSDQARVADQVHVYRVGRLPDGDSMR